MVQLVESAEDTSKVLFEAGAGALRFNAPLSPERADALIGQLANTRPRRVVDLGCGRGGLVRLVAAALQKTVVIGVDTDEVAIEAARRSVTADVGDRVEFEVGDAASWMGAVDAALCIGASHAFGGPAAMLGRLVELMPSGTAIVGDGVWEAEPNRWCLEAFGDLPTGSDGLAETAEAAGWTVVQSDLSTLAEWDAFEGGWVEGVRSVGSAEALAFAAEREDQYRQHYRGVLGFAWFVLRR